MERGAKEIDAIRNIRKVKDINFTLAYLFSLSLSLSLSLPPLQRDKK